MKKEYKKPVVFSKLKGSGIVPVALGAAALSVGGAFAAGVASGLMKDKKIDSYSVKSIAKVIS